MKINFGKVCEVRFLTVGKIVKVGVPLPVGSIEPRILDDLAAICRHNKMTDRVR